MNWTNVARMDKNFGEKISVREGVKNIQRGGYLKIAAEGREALTPPKIWVKYMYPPP